MTHHKQGEYHKIDTDMLSMAFPPPGADVDDIPCLTRPYALTGINVRADRMGILTGVASGCSAVSQSGAEMCVLKAFFPILPQALLQLRCTAAKFVRCRRMSGVPGTTT